MPKWHCLRKGSLLQRECQACQRSDKYSAVGFFILVISMEIYYVVICVGFIRVGLAI